ncbi:hypothetical protein JQS43_22135 [Natronosporangium hydrolyticum]|uniref:Uncharacterized protein n=1 Tax=Natronosporangium hydrolyticum TaxID=2811111 RepID=A0A895Y8X7_9ACTN|nr:hypothetical protein [Natronosporangium hydrolyticum]QSB14187.1 hypothetical protein JQS43_22135 [Natronosporangium hydrolyticum]
MTAAWRLPPADDQRPTYLAHAIALTTLHGPGPLPNGGYPLPDEDQARPRPMMPGAVLDGVRTNHGGVDPDLPAAVTLAHLIDDLVTNSPTTNTLGHLHDIAADQDLLPIADAVTRELTTRDLPTERLRQTGRWLAEYSTRRNAVALGILLLGLAGDHRDRDLLLLLGSLEDLSLYAAVALARSQPDRDQALFDLALRVAGWGRIHTVHRLAATHDPQIKAWLLRHGFRNQIMNEYLAHIAATTGDLHAALTTPPVDDELLDSAGDILTALCLGGPAEDITDYPDAPQTIEQYLALAAQRPPNLARVTVVLRLGEFIASDQAAHLNWTEITRTRLRQTCDHLVQRPDWLLAVDHAMDSPDLPHFRLAIAPARQLAIPTRTRIRARVHQHPDDAYLWQALTDDIDDVLTLAQQLLPLDRLAGGPALDVGLRADPPHYILDLIVSRLNGHPGKGWPLIRVAMGNPIIRNRNMAVRALTAWPPETVPDHIVTTLRRASLLEPDPAIRDTMHQLLSTWTTHDERHTPE